MKKTLIILVILSVYTMVFIALMQIVGFSNDSWMFSLLSFLFLLFGVSIIIYPNLVTNKLGKFGRWLIKNSVVSDIHVTVNKRDSKIYSIVFITLSVLFLMVPIVLFVLNS
jgi:hypothetical protein